jgi:Flp pilus assembly protein TadD
MLDVQSSEELVALAASLRRQGDFARARQAALEALSTGENNAAAWFNLGASLAGLGDLAASESAYRKALALEPQYAEAWSNLGGVCAALGRLEDALAAYRSGVAANDHLAPIWSNLCYLLCEAGRFREAEEAGRKATVVQPTFAPGWVNLGRALLALGRYPEAHAASRRAVDLAPGLPDCWSGLANSLMRLRRFDDAIAAYRKATCLQPENADLYANLGVALRRIGAFGPALDSLRRALAIDASHGFASWNLANALLEKGELAEGWRHYTSRWTHPHAPPRRIAPKGQGPVRGRVLLWGEQGLGDEILYVPMAAELAQEGVEITLETDPRLVPLFARSFPDLTVVARGDVSPHEMEHFDHVLPLGDLGGKRRREWRTFPRHTGYLVADAERVAHYKRRVSALAPASLVVGIAWRSNNPELGREKSAQLEQWCPILGIDGTSFVNLQYGDVATECAEAEKRCAAPIARLPELDLYNDIDGLSALICACDLVITTSNVTAHLAGALGSQAWILLPKRIGRLWYWFHDRTDSPWYPSLSLIAQENDGDWASAIQAAADRLRAMLAERR